MRYSIIGIAAVLAACGTIEDPRTQSEQAFAEPARHVGAPAERSAPEPAPDAGGPLEAEPRAPTCDAGAEPPKPEPPKPEPPEPEPEPEPPEPEPEPPEPEPEPEPEAPLGREILPARPETSFVQLACVSGADCRECTLDLHALGINHIYDCSRARCATVDDCHEGLICERMKPDGDKVCRERAGGWDSPCLTDDDCELYYRCDPRATLCVRTYS